QAVYQFIISNTGNGELTFAMTFEPHHEEERDEEWDQLFGFNATAATEDHRILGVLFAEDRFFVSGGDNGEAVNRVYEFDRAGRLVDQLDQPCRGLWGMHDLAWDGERIYGGCGAWIYSMNLEGGEVDSIRSPLIPPRGLAVDPETGDLWLVNSDDPIYHLDSDGDVLGTAPHQLRPYGLAWRADDPDGCPLYIFSADGESNLAVSKFNPQTGDFRFVVSLELEPDDIAGGCEVTTSWNGSHWVFVGVIQNPAGDRVALFDAGLNRSWISVDPESGVIQPDNRQECDLTISTAELIGGEYAIDLVIAHNAAGGELRLPITMVYQRQWAVVVEDNPAGYQLGKVYPNPSNGAGVITFHLPQPGRVNLVLYNQTGRRVADIAQDHYEAGSHRLTFSADELPSGIYFIRMTTNRMVRTRKFVMLK
ncbi:MAG TPA: T9SS type A sorting domain-containing protein, partial [Bacteroidetes bacterium]|nr:T9SS type A sorting domain-containing protein [Bacteroidota bacterium]